MLFVDANFLLGVVNTAQAKLHEKGRESRCNFLYDSHPYGDVVTISCNVRYNLENAHSRQGKIDRVLVESIG